MEKIELQPRIYHMTCDICGKKEDIVEKDISYYMPWYTKKAWSNVTFEHVIKRSNWTGTFGKATNHLDLCPECTKKFKKIIKNVNLEEE